MANNEIDNNNNNNDHSSASNNDNDDVDYNENTVETFHFIDGNEK